MLDNRHSVDWRHWLDRWDRMQEGYLEDREARFAIMLDALDMLLPPNFVALDVACGPGAISQRILARFPEARCIGIDLDPILLAMGEGALGDMGGRMQWIDADLNRDDWIDHLAGQQVDAALSTTALHWLRADHLTRLYRLLGKVIRLGGVFLNGDHIAYAPHEEALRRVSDTLKTRRRARAHQEQGVEMWEPWWDDLRREPALAELFAERERRFGWRAGGEFNPGYDLQVGALRDAGFREVGTIWQTIDNRVIMAVR
jgi:SAM-dependent methyltransferase